MIVLFGLAAFIFVAAAPLSLIMGRIHKRARAHRVGMVGPLFLALFGYLGGMIAAEFAAFSLLDAAYQSSPMPGQFIFLVLLVGCSVGSAVGASGGYAWIWFRTAWDADYDDHRRRSADRHEPLRRRLP